MGVVVRPPTSRYLAFASFRRIPALPPPFGDPWGGSRNGGHHFGCRWGLYVDAVKAIVGILDSCSGYIGALYRIYT